MSLDPLFWWYFVEDHVNLDALALAIGSNDWVEYECDDCCPEKLMRIVKDFETRS